MIKKWKKSTNQKIGKKKEKKTLVQRYIYVCTLNKVKKHVVKLMMFYCKTLLTPYVENHNQHD